MEVTIALTLDGHNEGHKCLYQLVSLWFRCAHVGGVQRGPSPVREPLKLRSRGVAERGAEAPKTTPGLRRRLHADGLVLEGGQNRKFTF